ncbi:hypothetical protein LPJ72_000218 [Coemansia sp. Benny D160-2]|nr:hypothetical protein LPJ72_000218 [Coemansia sp. Benny D160-2]
MARFFIPSNAADAGASCFGLRQHSAAAAGSRNSRAELFYHPAVRQEMALDMSLKKLHSIKQAQRSSHRQADLLKTVLVYNMFKAAMCGGCGEGEAPSSSFSSSLSGKEEECAGGAVEMDVDVGCAGTEKQSSGFAVDVDRAAPAESETAAAEAAEQSWFDRCIDRMLTEDELENDDDGDDDCDMSSAPVLLDVGKPSFRDSAAADGAEFSDTGDSASLFLEDATVAPSAASYSDEISSSSHIVPSSGFLKRSPSSASIQSLCMQQKEQKQQQQQQKNDDESALRLLAAASSHHRNQNYNNNSNSSAQRRHRALSNDSTSDAVIGRGEAAPHAASFTIHVGSHHHSPSPSAPPQPSWQFANFHTSRSSERTAAVLTQ